jgi:hypothetical protein
MIFKRNTLKYHIVELKRIALKLFEKNKVFFRIQKFKCYAFELVINKKMNHDSFFY